MISSTIARLGVRSIFGRWRGAMLLVLPIILLGMAVLVRSLAGDDYAAAENTLYGLGLVVIVPLLALLATSGLLAPEIDDGSISYLLAKPISRHTIVASKLVVALGCVVLFGALPMLLAGLIAQPSTPLFGLAFAVGSAISGAAYCAIFALLSVLTRHAVVIGLIYLLIWESLLGGLLDGVRWLSITRWSAVIVGDIADISLVADLPLLYALLATLVASVAGVWLAGSRLRSFNLTGDE